LEDVNENQIYLYDVSVLNDGGGEFDSWNDGKMGEGCWTLWGIDFTKEDDHPMPLLLTNIQFMYVSKIGATLEQIQNSVINSKEPMTSLEKTMCIYCWKTFPEEKLKRHQKTCDDFTGTCPKCYDGIGETKKELDEHLTWCDEPFRTPTDVKNDRNDHSKVIEKYGSHENYYKKQENETESYQKSIKKQAGAWKRIKDKKR
jgi:hypothetical protein